MANVVKVTKAQRFADIKALLSGDVPTYGTSTVEAVEFVNREIELLSRKNANRSSKDTAEKRANEAYKALILEYLRSIDSEGVSCSTVNKTIPELTMESNQKISALMRQLCEEGTVVKNVVRGKALFSAVA